MCGIVGLFSHAPANQELFDALTVLQHRGQDAAGIATVESDGRVHLCKGNGLVRDVFRTHDMRELQGNAGIGHVRYPTAGSDCEDEAQPFYVNSPYGILLVHNGNLTNDHLLKEALFRADLRHINTTSDSEILLNVLAHELHQTVTTTPPINAIFSAVERVHERIQGAYAVIAFIVNQGLLAFRDPHGIRPLVYGVRDSSAGREYMVASESVALDAAGFTDIQSVAPGEAIFIDKAGKFHRKVCVKNPVWSPCAFEFVYLARPDSIIDGISVHRARCEMGKRLAQKIKREWPEHDIDVVIPVPDTSRTTALPLAAELGVPFTEGFVKNRYIGRTFIMPGQTLRRKSVRQKLNTIACEFENKNVLLVDDSIVRGTTSREIIQMVRKAGAKKVYLASAAPPVRYANVYGIDMPARKELIAHNRTLEEISAFIGTDKLIYQDLSDLIEAICMGSDIVHELETSVFDGKYISGDVTEDYLAQLEAKRGA